MPSGVVVEAAAQSVNDAQPVEVTGAAGPAVALKDALVDSAPPTAAAPATDVVTDTQPVDVEVKEASKSTDAAAPLPEAAPAIETAAAAVDGPAPAVSGASFCVSIDRNDSLAHFLAAADTTTEEAKHKEPKGRRRLRKVSRLSHSHAERCAGDTIAAHTRSHAKKRKGDNDEVDAKLAKTAQESEAQPGDA
jgi:hypothetical protein